MTIPSCVGPCALPRAPVLDPLRCRERRCSAVAMWGPRRVLVAGLPPRPLYRLKLEASWGWVVEGAAEGVVTDDPSSRWASVTAEGVWVRRHCRQPRTRLAGSWVTGQVAVQVWGRGRDRATGGAPTPCSSAATVESGRRLTQCSTLSTDAWDDKQTQPSKQAVQKDNHEVDKSEAAVGARGRQAIANEEDRDGKGSGGDAGTTPSTLTQSQKEETTALHRATRYGVRAGAGVRYACNVAKTCAAPHLQRSIPELPQPQSLAGHQATLGYPVRDLRQQHLGRA